MRGFLAFIIVFILGLGCVGSNLQHIQPTEDKTHPGLDHFYPLESVSRVTLQNWKGEHILTGGEAKRFVKLLKEFHYDGNYAAIKPGHLWFVVEFRNGTSLSCYGTNEQIIISNSEDSSFITEHKINFENF